MGWIIETVRPRESYVAHGIPAVVVIWVASLFLMTQGSLFFALFVSGLGVALTALVLLLQHWSVRIAAFCNTVPASLSQGATRVLVYPPKHKGTPGFASISERAGVRSFEYQQKVFMWSEEQAVFNKLQFPDCETFGAYLSQGVLSPEAVKASLEKYGSNSVTLPTPEFRDLYKEHALAPFFVLQIFFVLLWCLDEYWMYAIMTGALLGLMEVLNVYKRLKTIKFLRSMVAAPGRVSVKRNGKSVQMLSSELVPGDVFLVNSGMVPCDAVVISGSCVVNEATLTGENVALLKDSIEQRQADEHLSVQEHRMHILFGGTKILQSASGTHAMAIRTGFASSQGKVLRTIAFASETVSANSREALFFLLFLLCFALVAAGYVLHHGLQNPNKSPYKLLLECVIILTSVVPPELPIELALAVTASLAALKAIRVFCTQPFRIPLAGKLDICAFDKTGTLTRDDLIYSGVVTSSLQDAAKAGKSMSIESLLVIGSCQSLTLLTGKPVGDPLESIAFENSGWRLKSGKGEAAHAQRKLNTEVLFTYPFNAGLRRMTVVAASNALNSEFVVCCKGAPEAIRELLRPEDRTQAFDQCFRHFAELGYRVIALATKPYPNFGTLTRETLNRQDVEKDLCFAGLLLFECPLRSGTNEVLQSLRDAGLVNIMITGDSELTAAAVATQTGMATLPTFILEDDGKSFEESQLRGLRKTHTLCMKGSSLEHLDPSLLPLVTVFARCSPAHKEQILIDLGRASGMHTLMCGDGTNDVGALKQADVGVALVFDDSKKSSDDSGALSSSSSVPSGSKKPLSKGSAKKSAGGSSKSKPKALIEDAGAKRGAPPPEKVTGIGPLDAFLALSDKADAMDESQSMNMGDASIAAPFTVRATNVSPVIDIVRQGRCSLVTTLQMYFILALNCLITAFSLSVLHLQGVRFGDAQMTITALIGTACFLFISRSKPLQKLAPVKPKNRIFSPYFLTSLMLQFAVHLGCLLAAVHYAETLTVDFVASMEDEFKPNVMNTAVFLVTASMQLATFTVNYQGHPFMMSLSENKPLRNTLMAGYVIVASAALGVLDTAIALSPLDTALRRMIVILMALDLAGSWLGEKVASVLFSKFNKRVQI